ncbi:MAG TPA: hypothetical protein VG735_16195 [Caulobacterales bacterium]|nr:hypothetical protein [Caulobacterales bacterium]
MNKFLPIAALLAMCVGACTTEGVGAGSSRSGNLSASFQWKENSAIGGQMTAAMSNGQSYSGEYFQVTHDTTVEHYAPLWVGWEGRRGYARDWGYWGPRKEFVTQYTGKVLANLSDAGGAHMRCVFTLRRPSSGMGGGGAGRCQLPGRVTIDAAFPSI